MSRSREQMLAWTGLVRTARHLLQAADAFLQVEFGLSFGEKSLMGQLAMDGGEVPMAELADRLVITRAGMTKMVDRLETAGLVTREASAADRRVTNVRLTTEGQAMHEAIRDRFVPWIGEHFGDHLTVRQLRDVRIALLAVVEAEGGVVPEARLGVE